MNEDLILPTLNLHVDPDFEDLDFVPETPRKARVDVAISNSFGFGGPNCCVVFKRFEG
jgi:3-oxoacyl-[acyl-carrier-protein] synthase II